MTSELTPSFPWTTNKLQFEHNEHISWTEHGSRAHYRYGMSADYHHAWNAFCVQWIAVGVCALVGKP